MPGHHVDLHNHLFEARTDADLTQGQLAEQVGVSRKSINKIENGIFIPSTVLALRLAAALQQPVDALFKLPITA